MNFSYLSVLQIFIIVFPLLTYPYLIRVIGLELYGVVLYGQTLMMGKRGDAPAVDAVRDEVERHPAIHIEDTSQFYDMEPYTKDSPLRPSGLMGPVRIYLMK